MENGISKDPIINLFYQKVYALLIDLRANTFTEAYKDIITKCLGTLTDNCTGCKYGYPVSEVYSMFIGAVQEIPAKDSSSDIGYIVDILGGIIEDFVIEQEFYDSALT